MSEILVAGVGNIFFGDDGFGVEVARRLARRELAPGIRVEDFGIGGVHLAFELLEPLASVVIADAVARGGPPGTLYVIEPELETLALAGNAHGMNLPAVFSQVQQMGGTVPPVTIVGCEPLSVAAGIGLSAPVAAAVDLAVARICTLATHQEDPHVVDHHR